MQKYTFKVMPTFIQTLRIVWYQRWWWWHLLAMDSRWPNCLWIRFGNFDDVLFKPPKKQSQILFSCRIYRNAFTGNASSSDDPIKFHHLSLSPSPLISYNSKCLLSFVRTKINKNYFRFSSSEIFATAFACWSNCRFVFSFRVISLRQISISQRLSSCS